MIGRILQAALDAADPYQAVMHAVQVKGQSLILGGKSYRINEGRIVVCGAGKAVIPMACALEELLGDRIFGGLLVAKHIPDQPGLKHLTLRKGSHPVPAEDSLASTVELMSSLDGLSETDLVICLISGGGSALLASPANGISLASLQETNRLLLASGASIHEMNAVRKHIDQVKGGGLWKRFQPARSACLILSDVIGNDLDVIASGPTVPDLSTFADAWAVIEKHHLAYTLPAEVREHLQDGLAGSIPETLKSVEFKPERTSSLIIASNRTASQAAERQANQEGFRTLLSSEPLTGNASLTGDFLAAQARQAAFGRLAGEDTCLVFGGETTVIVKGNGLGGRNLHTALTAVEGLAGLENAALVTFSTDGEDGPTPAAGAVVTGETLRRARQAGLDVQDYLKRNDSYHFFECLGDLIVCGPTGTNVNDISLVFLFASQP